MDTRLKKYFGFTFPDEFFLFWEFASQQPPNEFGAFIGLTSISLAGPFDVMSGRFEKEKARYDPCLHWRYFGDPPEFVTILTGGSDGLHWGYVVEDPEKGPIGIAGYYAYDDVTLFREPFSLFALLRDDVERSIKQIHQDAVYGLVNFFVL